MGSNNEEIVKAIQHYQDRLDRYVSSKSNDKVLYVLNKLEKLPIRTLHLEETGVGRTVNALKKCGGQVGEAAKSMVAKWKIMVLEEEQAAEEAEAVNEEEVADSAVESGPDSSYSSENENYEVEQFENELNDLNDVDFNTEEINNGSSHNTNKKTKHDTRSDRDNYGESSNKHKESNSKNKSERKRENDIVDENKYDKRKKSNEIELHNLESTKQRGDESKKKRDCGYDEDEKRKSKHEKSQLKRQRESSESESEEEKKNKSKKSHHKRDDSSDSESHHKKHKSKSSKEDKDSSKSKSKEKTVSISNKQSNKEKSKKHEDIKSSSDHSDKKDRSDKSESKSSKHDRDSHKAKSHSERKDKDKHKKEESKKSKDNYKPKEKESPKKEKSSSSKQSEKEKSSSSSSSKHKSNSSSTNIENSESKSKMGKEKTPLSTKTSKMVNGIDSESGASFAEALGMCGPLPVINKSSSSKKKTSSSSIEKPESTQTHKWKSVSPSEESTVEKYVPEALKDVHLEPLNLNIDNLLPEISPNYRPIGFLLDNQPKRIMTDDEALSRVMSNRNQKTKVYSGNKTRGKVESLFDLCVRVLQDNIDALEYTGGVPYSILKPILERATPDQLFNMEHHNPYLIEDTDELWQLHCQKEFRTKKREELESWREMYMRCLDEREARLTAITANIKQSQDKSLPVRTTKLAYVDSVAKPPRNIARKQVKNGIANEQKPSTAVKLSAIATSGEAGKVSVPNPGSRAVDRSSHSGSSAAAMKPKKAPLMAKTLSFLKNRFRR